MITEHLRHNISQHIFLSCATYGCCHPCLYLDNGELIHVYQTGQPQTACLNSMGLQKEIKE